MKKKIIEFCYVENGKDHLVPLPKPAKNFIPKWYKDGKLYTNSDKPSYSNPESYGHPNTSYKACMPFLDSLTTGYMIYTYCDIIVEIRDGNPYINWGVDIAPLVERPRDTNADTRPTPPYHYENDFAWIMRHGIKTPKGYSLLHTHPFNRFDLPFTTTSAISDNDVYYTPGAAPFFLKKGFEGIIPAGTPIVQVIPIKRDSWKTKLNTKLNSHVSAMHFNSRRVFLGNYKHNFWNKKIYE